VPLGFGANTTDPQNASITPIRNTDNRPDERWRRTRGCEETHTTNLARSTAGGDRTKWLQTALALI